MLTLMLAVCLAQPPLTCPQSCAAPSPMTADCRDLWTLSLLARIAGAGAELIRVVDAQRTVACALGDRIEGPLRWPGGRAAKVGAGRWDWPSGRTAQSSAGRWDYPDGTTARSTSGSWYFPGGKVARTAGGSWRSPRGRSGALEELLVTACAAEACPELALYPVLEGEAQEALLVSALARDR